MNTNSKTVALKHNSLTIHIYTHFTLHIASKNTLSLNGKTVLDTRLRTVLQIELLFELVSPNSSLPQQFLGFPLSH